MKTINDYAELVKEKHALNKTIAPVETDLTDASRGYHIGEQFINNGELFKAKTEIAQHDALVLNTNYEPADDLTTQIKNAGGGTGTDPRLDVFENNIAPVETDETDASKEYQVGEQLILNNILYDVIAPISEHDVITTTGSGANIAPADPLSSQFQTLTNEVSDISDEIADMNNVLGAKNLLENQNQGENDDKVVVTRNSDGSVTITTNGEVENEQEDIVLTRNFVPPVDGQYKLTGGYSVSIGLIAYDNVGAVWLNEDTGSGAVLTLYANRNYNFFLIVRQGTIISTPITISPMLRPNKIADDTYVPYSMTNREMTPYVQAISNPNLLDNPWFTVNQRGQSTYSVTGTTDTYTVDRWSMIGWSGKTVSFDVDSSGITFSAGVNSFRQRLYDIWDALVGKKLTLSIEYTSTEASGQVGIVKNNSWDNNTIINFKTGHNVDSVTFTAESGTTPILWVYIPETNTDFNIKAVKLELGSVSTLAMDTAPNYGTELLKCQRYFTRLKPINWGWLGVGVAWSESNIQGTFAIPTEMRSDPNVITHGVLQWYDGTNSLTIDTFSTQTIVNNTKSFSLVLASGQSVVLGPGGLILQGGAYIDLSADL